MSESDDLEAPRYLIGLSEPYAPNHFVSAQFLGAKGLDTDLRWHIVKTVGDKVQAPLTYVSSYVDDEPLPDLLRQNDVYVVSQRMREVIELWLKDHEFIPVSVHLSKSRDRDEDYGRGQTRNDYWWLNCWRRLDATVWEQSDVIERLSEPSSSRYASCPDKAIGWKRLVMGNSILQKEHFFGLEGFQGEERYVSDELRRRMLAEGLRVRFTIKLTGLSLSENPYNIEQRLNAI